MLDRRRALVRRARRPQVVRPPRRQQLLLEDLEAMDPEWPAADFDVEAEKERLALT